MLKNSEFGYNWIFKIITRYYNLIFLIPLSCCFYFFILFFVFLQLKTTKGWFFQRVRLYIWAIERYELSTLSIRVHNSLTVHDNSWSLKFDNFSEFQNVKTLAEPVTLLEKRLWHRCFPVNFAKFLRTLFLTEHLREAAS